MKTELHLEVPRKDCEEFFARERDRIKRFVAKYRQASPYEDHDFMSQAFVVALEAKEVAVSKNISFEQAFWKLLKRHSVKNTVAGEQLRNIPLAKCSGIPVTSQIPTCPFCGGQDLNEHINKKTKKKHYECRDCKAFATQEQCENAQQIDCVMLPPLQAEFDELTHSPYIRPSDRDPLLTKERQLQESALHDAVKSIALPVMSDAQAKCWEAHINSPELTLPELAVQLGIKRETLEKNLERGVERLKKHFSEKPLQFDPFGSIC